MMFDEKRYAGFTINLEQRFNTHLNEMKNGCKCRRCNWIRTIENPRNSIEMVILEKCNETNHKEKEIFWIAELRKQGHRLTNMTNGGDGRLGFKHSIETIEKMKKSNKHTKPTPEHIEKLRKTATERAKTPEAMAQVERLHINNIGKKQSKETCEKRSKTLMGHPVSEETKHKLKMKALGRRRRTPEQIAAHTRKITGKKRSIEQKKRYSEAKKLWWKEKKEQKNDYLLGLA